MCYILFFSGGSACDNVVHLEWRSFGKHEIPRATKG